MKLILLILSLTLLLIGCNPVVLQKDQSSCDGGLCDTSNIQTPPTNTNPPPTETFSPPIDTNQGIASDFPNDQGIDNHASVIFSENFETGDLDSILARWTVRKNDDEMSLASDGPNSSGGRAIQMTRLGGNNTGGGLTKRLDLIGEDNHNTLYLRYYVKLDHTVTGRKDDGSTGVISGSHHHTGGGLAGSAHTCNWGMGRAGIRPVGGNLVGGCPSITGNYDDPHPIYDNRFSVRLEAHENDRIDFYNYWMGMHHNMSQSKYYGNTFVNNDSIRFPRGEWTCIEYMLKLNTPASASNGEIKLWINGELTLELRKGYPIGKWLHSRFLTAGTERYQNDMRYFNGDYDPNNNTNLPDYPFEGFQWRESENLKLNKLSLAYYTTKDNSGLQNRVWYDNVVLATEYIGPITK